MKGLEVAVCLWPPRTGSVAGPTCRLWLKVPFSVSSHLMIGASPSTGRLEPRIRVNPEQGSVLNWGEGVGVGVG